MRKLIGMVALLVTLAGCGTATTPSAQVAPTGVQADTIFENALTDPYFSDLPKDTMIPAAHIMCNRIAGGTTVEQIAMNFIRNGFPPYAAGQFMGAGISVYCPEYKNMLDSTLAQYGG